MNRSIISGVALLILIFVVGSVLAQDTTDTGTTPAQATVAPTVAPTFTSGPTNNVTYNFIVCADQVVVDLSGFINPGWDVYFQVFTATESITGLRQVQVDGNFTFSERVMYTNGDTVPEGSSANVRVRVANENNVLRLDFVDTVTDVQDGCNNPQYALGTSLDLGGEVDINASSGSSGTTARSPARILSPFGGFLNGNRIVEDPVVIGARQSDQYRSDTPGLIFAECDGYTMGLPGIIYDSDNVTIFWSWYARTRETMQQHLDNANYAVKLNTAPLPNANLSEPVVRNRDWWVFYTVPIGNLRPGHYEIEFKLNWDQAISDGYEDFGPGTANEQTLSLCNFTVTRNPDGAPTNPNMTYNPTEFGVHDLDPEF